MSLKSSVVEHSAALLIFMQVCHHSISFSPSSLFLFDCFVWNCVNRNRDTSLSSVEWERQILEEKKNNLIHHGTPDKGVIGMSFSLQSCSRARFAQPLEYVEEYSAFKAKKKILLLWVIAWDWCDSEIVFVSNCQWQFWWVSLDETSLTYLGFVWKTHTAHKAHSVDGDGRHKEPSVDGDGRHKEPSVDGDGRHKEPSVDGDGRHKEPSVDGDGRHKEPSVDGDGRHKEPSVDGDGRHKEPFVDGDGRHKEPSVDGDGGHKEPSVDGDGRHKEPSIDGDDRHKEPCRHGNVDWTSYMNNLVNDTKFTLLTFSCIPCMKSLWIFGNHCLVFECKRTGRKLAFNA